MKTDEELIWESYENKCPNSILENAGILSEILGQVHSISYQISKGNYELDKYIDNFLEQCEIISEGRLNDIMQVSSDIKQLYNRQRKF